MIRNILKNHLVLALFVVAGIFAVVYGFCGVVISNYLSNEQVVAEMTPVVYGVLVFMKWILYLSVVCFVLEVIFILVVLKSTKIEVTVKKYNIEPEKSESPDLTYKDDDSMD